MAATIGTAAVAGAITMNGHEVATFTVDVPVTTTLGADTSGVTVTVGPVQPALAQALRDAADALDREEPADHEHQPKQHRDGKPPWCHACGLTATGQVPTGFRSGRSK